MRDCDPLNRPTSVVVTLVLSHAGMLLPKPAPRRRLEAILAALGGDLCSMLDTNFAEISLLGISVNKSKKENRGLHVAPILLRP